MSVFTNPASASPAQTTAYIDALLELLGDRDALTVLRGTPTAVREAAAGLSRAQLARPERDGKWSIRHILQHLADSEIVFGWRLRLVLAQDRPRLTGFDQDLWATRLRYDDADADLALDEFVALRAANLRMLERVPAAALQRIGIHEERGEESVAHMLRLYAGHDLVHTQQLARVRAAVE